MGFAVFHSDKGKGCPTTLGYHIDRTVGKEHTYQHADSSKKSKNIDLTDSKYKNRPLQECINERIKEGYTSTRKIRTDAVKYLKHIVSGTHEDMKNIEKDPAKLLEWIHENKAFFESEFGKENIIRFNVHLDEKTPHIHVITVPLDKKGNLNAKEIFGNKTTLSERQDRYCEQMKQFGLNRGLKDTGIKHEDVKEYYKRLNVSIQETKTVVNDVKQTIEKTDITIFNIGKKKAELSKHLGEKIKSFEIDKSNLLLENLAEKQRIIQRTTHENNKLKYELETREIKEKSNIIDVFNFLCDKNVLEFDKQIRGEAYYKLPGQNTGSIAVNERKQVFNDFSSDAKGDIFKALEVYYNLSFNQGREFLQKFEGSKYNKSEIINKVNDFSDAKKLNYQVTGCFNTVNNVVLLEYAKSRNIEAKTLENSIVKQINYKVFDSQNKESNYFALGVEHQNGFSVRNEKFKGNLGGVGLSAELQKSRPEELVIFEGMFDYLTYKQILSEINDLKKANNIKEKKYDFLILNSTQNVKNLNTKFLELYKSVSLLLNNDTAGKEAINSIMKTTDKVKFLNSTGFFSKNIANFNDLNSSYNEVSYIYKELVKELISAQKLENTKKVEQGRNNGMGF